MKRRAFAGGVGLLVLLGVLLAVGTRTATTVWADPSSMDWDVQMQDPVQNPAHACPGQSTSNDGDGIIETGECPDVVSIFSLQPEGGQGGRQSFFDRANVVWTTGPLGASDITGDGRPDPTNGLAVNRPSTLGARVGTVSIQMQSSLLVAALIQNNIDDVSATADPHITGQPMSCGADINGDTTVDTVTLSDTLELWNAITDDSNGTVSAAETQSPDPAYPSGCYTGRRNAPACAPKGVRMLPIAIQVLETALGLPEGSLVSRAYGIARMPIVGGIESNMDVNLLVYRLDSAGISGYLTITLVQYLGLRSPDPTMRGYSPLAQTFETCPPYRISATIFGITTRPDFNEDAWLDMDPSFTPELNRLIIGTGGPYNYEMLKSTAADYDGDTIPDYADRCALDPNSGTAAQDTDGDTLTGPCETLGTGNGEGNNPKVGIWNANPPWDTGQDVDGDGYLNYVDNCPVVADRDLDGDTIIDYQRDTDGDTVGDVCEIDLASSQGWPTDAYRIPGDGHGYPGRMVGNMYQVVGPGMYVDRDNICSDPFTIGAAEPQSDVGRWCAGSDRGPTGSNLAVLGRAFADSNDDAMPDLLDYPAGDPIEFEDVDSDSDFDGYSDACEAFTGSDPLDGSSIPPAPATANPSDCDGDTVPDATDSNPFTGLNPDADRDGCTRAQENPGAATGTPGSTAAGGVSFSDQAWYDFYDVPAPVKNDPTPNGTRDKSVNVSDVVSVLKYAGTSLNGEPVGGKDYDSDKDGDTVPDGMNYDRSASPAPNPPYDAGPPDGVINVTDVVAILKQAGLGCG